MSTATIAILPTPRFAAEIDATLNEACPPRGIEELPLRAGVSIDTLLQPTQLGNARTIADVRDAIENVLPAGKNVHFGSLSMPRSAVADFSAALHYLSGAPESLAIFDRLEHAAQPVVLACNAAQHDGFLPGVRADTIFWDPHAALRMDDGARLSPALLLLHEAAHAAVDPAVYNAGKATPDRHYDNDEERRTIAGPERRAAQILGEDIRYTHQTTEGFGDFYSVATPERR